MRYYFLRDLAWKFLIKHQVSAMPLNLDQIAKEEGWVLCGYEKFAKVADINQNDLILWKGDGFTINFEGKILICFNQNKPEERVRFTIAHEFGHILLHSKIKPEDLEKEADMFAARILAPLCLIKALNVADPRKLSKIFKISQNAAAKRLRRCVELESRGKFFTNKYEIKFFKQMKGWLKSNDWSNLY